MAATNDKEMVNGILRIIPPIGFVYLSNLEGAIIGRNFAQYRLGEIAKGYVLSISR